MFTSFQYYLLLICVGFFCIGTLNLCCCNEYNITKVGCLDAERQALVNFKEGLNDSKNRLSSWVGKDCCNWRGIRCNNRTGHVVMLNLRNTYQPPSSVLAFRQMEAWTSNGAVGEFYKWCISGEINPSLLELKHLNHLDLSRNCFGGVQIPKFIGSFKKLKYLNLSRAEFGGKVPCELGNLSRLTYFDINNDQVLQVYKVADIPTFYSWVCAFDLQVDSLSWVSRLSSLKYLDMSYVDLSMAVDWLPSLDMIPSIQVIKLDSCSLSTMTPTTSLSFANFTSLSTILLSANSLGPKVPSWLFNISSLAQLGLSKNGFNDSISTILESLCNLHSLRLCCNEFNGDMNQDFNGAWSSKCNTSRLEYLDLHRNKLSGQIPSWLGQFANLKYLFLDQNYFFGSIPNSLVNLTSLEILFLSNNQLRGTIPECLGQLSNLKALHLRKNSFAGTLSELAFSNLTNLKTLALSSNSLALNVSSMWIPPFQLKSIAIDNCKLGTHFPSWLQTQKSLEFMSLVNSSLLGMIPSWIWNISLNLFYVDLSKNSLSGAIPSWIGEVESNLMHLSLSSNILRGQIPTSVCKSKLLLNLDLSSNQLTDEIPQCLGIEQPLSILNLENNFLSGDIHSRMGLFRLDSLHLGKNELSGELPSSCDGCKDLIVIDLGENKLSGELPKLL